MEVVVQNTSILIKDYEKGSCESIENYFRIFDPITHSFNVLGLYYDENTKTLYLPAGVDMWWIEKRLGTKGFKRVSHHPYLPLNKKALFKEHPRDDNQRDCIKFLTANEGYEENQYQTQLSLQANVGLGKTYCTIMSILMMNAKSIIITGSSSLLSQWEKEFDHFSNLNGKDILMITGSDMINHILTGKSKIAKEASIYLITHKTLESFGTQYGYQNIGRLFEVLGIGIKIFDEYHTQFRSMLMIDFFTNVWKTFYLSATAGRSSFDENKIFQATYNKMNSIDLFDPEVDPRTSYVAIRYNSRPSPLDIQRCTNNKYHFDMSTYCNYVTKKPEFYQMMHIVMQMVIKADGPCLMFVHTNDAVLRLYKWIAMTYPQFLGDIGIFTSLLPKEEKIKEKKKRLIITTVKSAGAGQDIKHLKYTFMLAEPFRSEILARQTLGRTRDRDTTYVELVDMGFKKLNSFYRAKLPVFNKYATSVSDVTLDNYELRKRYENIVKQRVPWKECPIELFDERFEFPDDLKVREDSNPHCPIEFFDEDDLSNWVPII